MTTSSSNLPWSVYAAGGPGDTTKTGAALTTIGAIIDAGLTQEQYRKALECDATIVQNWLRKYLPSGTLDIVREKLFDKIPDGAILQTMPHSEVCMHMEVAGRRMFVAPVGSHMAQLYTLAGEKFSFPITAGEAGISHHLG